MKRQPKRSKRKEQKLQLWTYPQAQAACPYIRSIVASLREHHLEVLALQRRRQQLAARPGRPSRTTLIADREAQQQLDQTQGLLEQAAEELDNLNIFVLDSIQGLALIPFVHQDQLAWYVFDLHDPKPLRFWRYQEDPLETRRPITAAQQERGEPTRLA